MTTIDDPNEWGHNDNITKDRTVALVRAVRGDIDDMFGEVAKALVENRALIAAQSEHIAELEADKNRLVTDLIAIADLEKRIGEGAAAVVSAYLKVVADLPSAAERDDYVPNTVGDASIGKSRMTEDFADMVIEKRYPMHIANRLPPPDLAKKMKQRIAELEADKSMLLGDLACVVSEIEGEDRWTAAKDRRAKNVTRLVAAARSHIKRGNYAVADMLLAPLAQGVHDVYDYKEDADNSGEARPKPTCEVPYLFDGEGRN